MTEWFLLGAILFLIGVEIWALLDQTPESPTITATVRKYIKRYPILAFAAGIICGHLFWGGC